MDEDVASADFAEEDALGGMVEEAREVPGQAPGARKDEAQGEVLDKSKPSQEQRRHYPKS